MTALEMLGNIEAETTKIWLLTILFVVMLSQVIATFCYAFFYNWSSQHIILRYIFTVRIFRHLHL